MDDAETFEQLEQVADLAQDIELEVAELLTLED